MRHMLAAAAVLAALSMAGLARGATLFPENGAESVCPDTPLKITLEKDAALGAGKIQIIDSADGSVVETIDVASPEKTQPIGGSAPCRYHAVTASGSEVAIYPANGELKYDRRYRVTVDAGAIKDAGGTFAGIAGASWEFRTRKAPPAPGAARLTVAADGSGDFCTVQGAIDFIPAGNTTATRVFLKKGVYAEMVYIANKHAITLEGEDRKTSIIAYETNATYNPQHRGVLMTQRINDFVLSNLTIRNTTRQGGSQAECIIFGGTATARAIVKNVELYSFQDTLQINGQAYLRDCYIEGDVDFMWGSGPCFFENCEAKTVRSNAYYTQIRNTAANHGYVYYRCTFSGAPGITGNMLSRIAPVRFPASEVVLIDCTLSSAVADVGWKLDASTPARAGTPATETAETLAQAAANVRFWEYNSHDAAGKPVDVSKRLGISRQLSKEQDALTIAHYSDPAWVLGGWDPRQEKAGQ